MRKLVALAVVWSAAIAASGAVAVSVAHAQPSARAASQPALTSVLTGPCTAEATINETGLAINPSVTGVTYSVPHSGSATYSGSVTPVADERAISGNVSVSLPVGSVSIKSWSDDDADDAADAGIVTWDIPSWLPGGVILPVSGQHSENGAVLCSGSIQVKLDGDILDGPVGVASVVATALTALGIVGAAIPK
jgi:hypothetical protein